MSDYAAVQKAQTATCFNTMAAEFDSQGGFAHFGRRLVDVVGVEAGQRVLDVATGRGAVLFPAIERVGSTGDAVGIDLAEDMVHAANDEAERRGWGRRVSVMDAERLDFPDGTFDRVLCGFGVMFFPHLDHTLAQFRRVLKPAGRLGVSAWHASPAEDLHVVLGELSLLGSTYQRPPGWINDPDDLTRVVKDAGFTDVWVVEDSVTFVFPDVEHYWHSLRGNFTRRIADSLDPVQTGRVRAALTERFRAYERPDGIHVEATALLGVGSR